MNFVDSEKCVRNWRSCRRFDRIVVFVILS
jgi:hypothetical protein